ncbi:MAG: TonB-dependent receptor [Bacteroidales bacterium]|nr:TonB-dependent receptor [Bacteroidales bacterium]
MRLAKLILLLALLLLLPAWLLAQTGTIRGRVFNEKTNEPLPFVNIVVFGTSIGSTSDLDGNFLFTGITPGFVKLSASFVGFESVTTTEFLVTNARTSTIEIPMREIAIQLEQVVVQASLFKRKEESPVSMRTLGIQEIEKNPGGNRDISRVIQSLPGVASTPAYRNDVIVRGGGPSESRFYLDGIEIPNLNHFATQGASGGPVGIINVDFIREVDLYSGAFPSNRGNALSAVLEMRQTDGNPDKVNFRGSVGASDLALTLDGPLGERSNFIMSARRSYLQFLFDAIGLPFLPTYNDFQARYRINFDTRNQLTIIGLGAIDQFRLNTGIENPDENQQYILDYLPVNEQWNYTIGGVYRHFTQNGNHMFVLSRNMLRNAAFKFRNNDETEARIFDYDSDEIENKFRYERNVTLNGFRFNYGAGTEYAKYLNETYREIFRSNEAFAINYDSYIDLFKWSVFGQVSKSVLQEKLNLSLGLRSDANSYSKSMSNLIDQLSPRFSASYALTEKFYLNFNTGRFYQLPPYTSLGFRNNDRELVNKNNDLKYISADHLVAGIEYQRNEEAKFTIEGFFKNYRNYPFSVADSISIANKGADFGTYGDEEVVSISKGRAYGMEVLLQERDLAGFNIIMAYTFVRSEFQNTDNEYIPSAWDNRHILNLTVGRQLKGNWDIGAKWRFVGGAPYTPWDIEKSSRIDAWEANSRGYLDFNRFNSLRFGNFHQLDIRIDKSFFFNRWSLMLYTDIQNAYNFQVKDQNILVREFDANGNPLISDGRYSLRELENLSGTVLPTIGIIVEF